jgi:ornithine carbamoyltransferase
MNATATSPAIRTNDLLTGMEWSPAQTRELLHLAADVKARPDRYRGALAGRFLALIFEKPSLRTRVSFEVGIASLGGGSVFLDHTVSHLGEREPVGDVAKSLSRWVNGIVARVFKQEFECASDQRAFGSLPSVPGIRGFLHAGRAVWQFARAENRVRRRWQ